MRWLPFIGFFLAGAIPGCVGSLFLPIAFDPLGLVAALEEAKKPEDTVMVMVAARDLQPGVAITEMDLVAIEIPPRFLSEGVYLSPGDLVGQQPRSKILVNEFVRHERISTTP